MLTLPLLLTPDYHPGNFPERAAKVANWLPRPGKAKVTYAEGSSFEGVFNGERIKEGAGKYTWMKPAEEDGEDPVVSVVGGGGPWCVGCGVLAVRYVACAVVCRWLCVSRCELCVGTLVSHESSCYGRHTWVSMTTGLRG